jgi:hypothetical protein
MLLGCDHVAECQCYTKPGAAAQSLDELEFVRSACHHAATGNLEKLERILKCKPDAVSCDGSTGACRCTTDRAAMCVAHDSIDCAVFVQAALATHLCIMQLGQGS